MGVRDYLPGIANDGTPGVHYECRDCGTNVDDDRESCPTCNGEVVSFQL